MMNKKAIGIAIATALVLSLFFAAPVFADDPDDTVNITWTGPGAIAGSVGFGDDATINFSSFGVGDNTGSFDAADQNDNPYSYGVDTCWAEMTTNITGGGIADFTFNRTDSTGMYGPAGQTSYTYVLTADGTAKLQNSSWMNYAELKDCNYGWMGYNNPVIDVNGSSYYELQRYMDSGGVDYAEINAIGSGSAYLECMGAETSGCWPTELGCGCGNPIPDDMFTATGAGTMQLIGTGTTTATTAMAPTMTGASSFNFIASWIGGATFTVPDYYTTVD